MIYTQFVLYSIATDITCNLNFTADSAFASVSLDPAPRVLASGHDNSHCTLYDLRQGRLLQVSGFIGHVYLVLIGLEYLLVTSTYILHLLSIVRLLDLWRLLGFDKTRTLSYLNSKPAPQPSHHYYYMLFSVQFSKYIPWELSPYFS